jgi:uncharacterized protein with GYD domain
MSHYLLRWQLKDSTVKHLVEHPQDRTGPAETLIKGFGGKLISYYFAFGDYDGIGIAEFGDNISAAACSLTAAATGAFARFETTALLTAKEAKTVMEKAKQTKTGYKPMNA